MAKGHEDTALYVYNRLVSLNDVGANPLATSVAPKAFHQRMLAALRWPHGMNATATHDTKRSEDVRARINVLSELPEEWERHLFLWRGLNEKKKRSVKGEPAPDRNEEILLYQTLLGAWPLDPRELPGFAQRIKDYMVKALREAKVHTRWISPKPELRAGGHGFCRRPAGERGEKPFPRRFYRFPEENQPFRRHQQPVPGAAQDRCAGCPRFLPGHGALEPPARRPRQPPPRRFFRRRRAARRSRGRRSVRAPSPCSTNSCRTPEDGRIKLYVTWKGLRFRKEQPDLFRAGDYQPLTVSGEKKEHVLAFARQHADRVVIVAVPRLATRLVAPGAVPPRRQNVGEPRRDRPPEGVSRPLAQCVHRRGAGVPGRKKVPVTPPWRCFRAFPPGAPRGAPLSRGRRYRGGEVRAGRKPR